MNKPNYMDIIADQFPNLSVTSFGDPSDYTSLVATAPAVVPPQAQLDGLLNATAIDMMWAAIKAERDRRTQNGGSHVGAYWYHSDQPSRTQQIALVLLGANMPQPLLWKTMSGEFVNMTPTLAQQVFLGAVGLDQAVFTVAETHHARMAQTPTPWSYDFSTGWPLMYEETL
jgi:hypothetical protein